MRLGEEREGFSGRNRPSAQTQGHALPPQRSALRQQVTKSNQSQDAESEKPCQSPLSHATWTLQKPIPVLLPVLDVLSSQNERDGIASPPGSSPNKGTPSHSTGRASVFPTALRFLWAHQLRISVPFLLSLGLLLQPCLLFPIQTRNGPSVGLGAGSPSAVPNLRHVLA